MSFLRPIIIMDINLQTLPRIALQSIHEAMSVEDAETIRIIWTYKEKRA